MLEKEDESCGTTANHELLGRVKKELIGDMDISSTQIEVKALQCNIILLIYKNRKHCLNQCTFDRNEAATTLL